MRATPEPLLLPLVEGLVAFNGIVLVEAGLIRVALSDHLAGSLYPLPTALTAIIGFGLAIYLNGTPNWELQFYLTFLVSHVLARVLWPNPLFPQHPWRFIGYGQRSGVLFTMLLSMTIIFTLYRYGLEREDGPAL